MTYKPSRTLRISYNSSIYPETGTIGHVGLLRSAARINEPLTVNPSQDTLVFATAQSFATAARVKITSTLTLAAPLVATETYFMIRVDATTYKLAASQADAIAGIAINLIDAGTGALTLNEQFINEDDPLSVLATWELTFPGYSARFPVSSTGIATIDSQGSATKSVNFSVKNNGSSAVSIGGYLFVRGGTATIGNTTGDFELDIPTSPLTIAPGETKGIDHSMGLS